VAIYTAWPGAVVDELLAREELGAEHTEPFDPSDAVDRRERLVAEIVRRRGQPAFRRRLVAAYEGRCVITGCDALEALEAAHISPYRGPMSDSIANGLLLRADVHTLFDLGLISVDAETNRVLVAPRLRATQYAAYAGVLIRLPAASEHAPHAEALAMHRRWSGL
jgi:putative restriction endonuclease